MPSRQRTTGAPPRTGRAKPPAPRPSSNGRSGAGAPSRSRAAALAVGAATPQLLQRAVEEAARLLEADGAMIYLLDPSDGVLHFAHDAGIDNLHSRRWVRRLQLRLGQGMFGVAVEDRRVVLTGDYLADASFVHAEGTDRFVREVGLRSMIVAPLVAGDRTFGALGTFSRRTDAFNDAQIGLVRSLADHAAAAMANALLIEELARSRVEVERRAEAERTLREIAARITAIRDPNEILQLVIDAATRLLHATGGMMDLVGSRVSAMSWARTHAPDDPIDTSRLDATELELDAGVSGRAIRTGAVQWTGDYLADTRFDHRADRDDFVRENGIASVVAAPLMIGGEAAGAITIYDRAHDGFSADDGQILQALADQAAIAIQNARLIEELERTREEVQRRADAERSLRQIGANISAIRDSADVLQQTVSEASRLLRADGAIIDLLEPDTGALRWAFDTGMFGTVDREIIAAGEIGLGEGIAGLAVAERRVIRTGEYASHEYVHTPAADEFIAGLGIRSVIVAPIVGEAGPVGAIEVFSRRGEAFDELDAAVLGGLADQAAIAIQNARLIEALDRSGEEIRHRADAEATLRQIAANISALRDSDVILQQTVDEARRLLDSRDARIDLVENGRLVWKYTSSTSAIEANRALEDPGYEVGQGIAGWVVVHGGPFRTGDYLGDDRFVHTSASDAFVRASGIRSVIAVPLLGESGPLGAISVATDRPEAYDDAQAQLLQAVADHAAIAIQNARLIEALERSQVALARRAETERSLREMAGRIAELREPDDLLRRIVDDSSRLLGSDGAHLTRMSDDGTHVVPVVVSGGLDEVTEAWLKEQRFPVDAGINGLAAGMGEPVWTADYTSDARIPLEPDDLETAERLGLRGMAAAPLRSPEGGIIGTLAVSFRAPHEFEAEEIAVLKGLADHAAIALTNTNLYERLRLSEASYRHLVQNSPDIVWSVDADARFSFISATVSRITGWEPEELLGKHFGALVHESTGEVARIDWTAGLSTQNQELRGRLNLLHRDGHGIPAEYIALSALDANGRFAGANGSVRDMTERDRLERELQESEKRYRFLVQNSPDVIFSIDADGAFTYISETIERITGFEPAELRGRHFSTIVDPGSMPEAAARWALLVEDPATPQTVQLNLSRRDGSPVAVEVNSLGLTDESGGFSGITGSTRDVTEREGLQLDLRRQAAELAAGEERSHLARELHDSVTQALFSMTLLTRTTELLLDRDIEAARKQLGSLRDLQREALAEMRALIFELRPGNLEQDGLMHALKTHSAALQGRIGLPIVVKGTELADRLPIEIEEVLYRIAQEALHNVVKHAGARQVRVELAKAGTSVRLRVVDDGRGFEPGQVGEGHLGLTGMRARAAKIGAGLEVRSRPGDGTTIEVSVPAAAIAASRARASAAARAEPAREGAPASAE